MIQKSEIAETSAPVRQQVFEQLPLWQALIYGMGIFGTLSAGAMNSLSLNIFNITLGVDAALISLAMGIVQLTGVVLDPVVAHFSDNFHSRWGRRRPFMVVGGMVAGLAFAVLWMVPTGWSDQSYFWWYLTLSLVLNVGNSMFGGGYYALGIELAPNYKERTRIMAIRSYFGKTNTFINPWLFWLAQMSIFGGAMNGIKWVGALVGGIIIASSFCCAYFIRERFATSPALKSAAKPVHPILNFFQTVKSIGDNRYFWICLGVSILLASGLAIFDQIGNYVNIYFVFRGDTKVGAEFYGYTSTVGAVLAISAIPFAQWLCNRLGKHVAIRLALGWMMLGSVLKWWLYNPAYPYLILLVPIFYSVGIPSFWLILPSMQADVVDIDELYSGKRREAMFGAVSNLGVRVSSAFAMILLGVILNATGFDRDQGGNQTEQTFFWMRFLFSFAMGLVLLSCFAILSKYDLTAERMEEVRVELEKRRNKI